MQRDFGGMCKQVDTWRESQLSDVAAKSIIYHAFIESGQEVVEYLQAARTNPQIPGHLVTGANQEWLAGHSWWLRR
jgi:hypothetical protein